MRLPAAVSAAPQGAQTPDRDARWSDIRLLPDNRVQFARPLWIDLSGIAKGYTVDRLIEIITATSASRACVNAGGDLRVMGEEPEWVRVSAVGDESSIPVIEVRNGSVASSGHRRLGQSGACDVAHIDGVLRHESPVRFVCVLASMCRVADALTKVVMARGGAAQPVVRSFGARALFHEEKSRWQELA